MRRGSCSGSRGFTFVAVLLLLALLSLGLAEAGPSWAQQSRREREQEFFRIGLIYAQAIASYREVSPGSRKPNPQDLALLLDDRRFLTTMRHLRRLYDDPVVPGQAWAAVRDSEGAIVGVRSRSDAAPLAEGSVALADRVLPPARRYSDWIFLAVPTPP